MVTDISRSMLCLFSPQSIPLAISAALSLPELRVADLNASNPGVRTSEPVIRTTSTLQLLAETS